ncbi:hypothetical protein HON58_03260, partial [Candidatus Peregrinibacteria bacterium]|nr:hypothetical protein [Candidatus Peregrinibacteria bacterium]
MIKALKRFKLLAYLNIASILFTMIAPLGTLVPTAYAADVSNIGYVDEYQMGPLYFGPELPAENVVGFMLTDPDDTSPLSWTYSITTDQSQDNVLQAAPSPTGATAAGFPSEIYNIYAPDPGPEDPPFVAGEFWALSFENDLHAGEYLYVHDGTNESYFEITVDEGGNSGPPVYASFPLPSHFRANTLAFLANSDLLPIANGWTVSIGGTTYDSNDIQYYHDTGLPFSTTGTPPDDSWMGDYGDPKLYIVNLDAYQPSVGDSVEFDLDGAGPEAPIVDEVVFNIADVGLEQDGTLFVGDIIPDGSVGSNYSYSLYSDADLTNMIANGDYNVEYDYDGWILDFYGEGITPELGQYLLVDNQEGGTQSYEIEEPRDEGEGGSPDPDGVWNITPLPSEYLE